MRIGMDVVDAVDDHQLQHPCLDPLHQMDVDCNFEVDNVPGKVVKVVVVVVVEEQIVVVVVG